MPQGVQEEAPPPAAKVPLPHASQAPIPAPPAARPGAQGAHVETLAAPMAADALPGGQSRQDSAPKPGWNDPAAHGAHVPLGKIDVPAPQLEHCTAPLMLYPPGAQHRPAPSASASNPGGQKAQDVPPVRPLNLPSGQSVHAVAPKLLDTDPMGHAAHARMELAVAEAL
jgi:hypothetical protein